jgi:hypothetical protein
MVIDSAEKEMNGLGVILVFSAATLACLRGSEAAQTAGEAQPEKKEASVEMTIKKNQTQSIGALSHLTEDCQAASGQPSIQIIKAPSYGKIDLGIGQIVAKFAADHPRAKCNGQTVPTINIYYTPGKDFTGKDMLELQFLDGGRILYKFNIE